MKTPLLNSFKSAFIVFLLAFLLVPSILEAKVLKVLAIGNSFSNEVLNSPLGVRNVANQASVFEVIF